MGFILRICRHAGRVMVVALILFTADGAKANTYYVDRDFQGENPRGDSWLSAYPSLQAAIDAAAESGGGVVWVKAGIYKPQGKDRNSTFTLKPGISLLGGFRGTEDSEDQRNPTVNQTVLSGDIGTIGVNSDNCFHIVSGAPNCRLDGFIISGGNANGPADNALGGGIYLPVGTTDFKVANCTFEKNNALWLGGGLYADKSNLVLTNCTFYSNAAESGGGLAARGKSTVRVGGSIFTSNFAKKSSGAVDLQQGTDAVIHTTRFLFNATDGRGGAVCVKSDEPTNLHFEMAECTFNGNSAKQNGGALLIRGSISPVITACTFYRNIALFGAGAIACEQGTVTVVENCLFTKNKGITGSEDMGIDETSLVLDSLESLADFQNADAEPVDESPATQVKRTLSDVYVFGAYGAKLNLRTIVGTNQVTVLILGELTDPDFIEHYRGIEAIAHDYNGKGIQFFYVYRFLTHPENNGYLQPFNVRERARQAALAEELLMTGIPWLCDSMDNQTAKVLAPDNRNNLFIYTSNEEEQYTGSIDNIEAIRAVLEELAGPTKTTTSPDQLPDPQIKPVNVSPPDVVDRLSFNPKTNPFSPLQITPMESHFPFYVKLRAEGSEALLNRGSGQLYLGFNIDPLYQQVWDNQREPLEYEVFVAEGVATPALDSAPRITEKSTDSEPREFLLNAYRLDLSKPLALRVDYVVYSLRQKKRIEVSQRYLVHLAIDAYGGAAFRRQIVYSEPKVKWDEIANTTIHPALRKYDANGDGKLTRNEVVGQLYSKFPDIDTNRDGYLNSEEYSRYLRNR